MRGSALITLALLVVPFVGGCARYRQRVVEDFRDTFKLSAGIGIGLYADAKVTSYLDAGIGWGGYWANIGLESRYADFLNPTIMGCSFPLGAIPGVLPDESPVTGLRMANVHDGTRNDMRGEYAVVGQLFDASALAKWDAYGPEKKSAHTIFRGTLPDEQFTEHPLGLEAGVGILIVDARVGFDPVEFFDLIGALFGLDLLGDHWRNAELSGSSQ